MRFIFGYLFIALAGILFLALISFSPLDSIFFTSSVSQIPQNIAGKAGAFISSIFIISYGKFASYLLDFAILTLGINFLTSKKIGKTFIKFLLIFISALSLSIAITSISKTENFIDSGVFGIVITNLMKEFLPKEFIFILFLSLFFISLISSMKLFSSLVKLIGKALLIIFIFPFGIIFSKKAKKVEKDLSFLEKESPQILNEKNTEPQTDIKVPEFLKTDTAQPERTKLPEETPKWLSDNAEKAKLIEAIKEKTEEILIQDEKKEENTQLTTIEDPVEVETQSYENSVEEIDSPTLIEEEPEEITAEADYKEIITHRLEEKPEKIFVPQKGDAYIYPNPEELEKNIKSLSNSEIEKEIKRVSEIIETTFTSFKIDVKVSGYSRGPSITRYEIVPPDGLKLRSIVNLSDDLALKLGTKNLRIVAPIGNKSIVGIEVPNQQRDNVVLRDIIESPEYKNTRAILPLILGKDIAGNIIIEDLTEMPHLLIAGTTGSGKSVFVNSLIAGIVFHRTSEEVKFIFIDPKMVELELYDGIPHLISPVITNPEEAIAVLEWVSEEMDRRYNLLSVVGERNIVDYNKEVLEYDRLPYIVVIIDEFANLMLRLPKETEKIISRLAAMARAVGIHLVVATQRPSVDVVTGIIKANFPSRIAFRVSSQTDSRTILDKAGAEKLLGKGDLLFMTPNFIDLIRIQAPFVSIKDVETIVKTLKRNGTAEYLINPIDLIEKETEEEFEDTTDYTDDPIFADCLKIAVENGEVSASFLQRRFRIGYNRASRIIDAMDRMKILGPSKGAGKPREVLIGLNELNEILT
ncbi:MAG: DNA translocase FtsK [Brevinematales bacterium]|nr:DNA translocase FtsK [Brevinematales bacterium]